MVLSCHSELSLQGTGGVGVRGWGVGTVAIRSLVRELKKKKNGGVLMLSLNAHPHSRQKQWEDQ